MESVRIKARETDEAQAAVTTAAGKLPDVSGLAEQAASGDFEAFGEIYGTYVDPIYRYVLYHVKDRMTAEDVTEEVFLKAWKAIDSCKGRGQTFRPWLYRIAHNHTVNVLRKMQKSVSLEKSVSLDMETLVEVEGPEKAVISKLTREGLFDAITGLPENQRQVVILKFIEGLDNREIGEVMNKREGAIRVLQMRALSRLRQEMRTALSEDGG